MGCNFLEGKFKKFIDSMCCDYLIRKYNGKRKCSKDDISVMLADFQQSKEIKFTTLSNIPINEYYQQMKIPISTRTSSLYQSPFQLPRMSSGLLPIIQYQNTQISMVYKKLLQKKGMIEKWTQNKFFHFHCMDNNPCFAAIHVISREFLV